MVIFSFILVILLVSLSACFFRGLLLLFSLALEVVLGEIAVLAKTVGVMWLVGVLTCRGSSHFAFSIVALEAHTFGVLVLMITNRRGLDILELLPHLLGHLLLNLLLEDVLDSRVITVCQERSQG